MTLKEYNSAREQMELEIEESRKKFKEAGYLYLKANKRIKNNTAVSYSGSLYYAVTTGECRLTSHTGVIEVEVAYGSSKGWIDQENLEVL